MPLSSHSCPKAALDTFLLFLVSDRIIPEVFCETGMLREGVHYLGGEQDVEWPFQFVVKADRIPVIQTRHLKGLLCR